LIRSTRSLERYTLDDAVDEVIERVITGGGEVYFDHPGVLDLRSRIAAVLRS
jgi:hypothetical protein